MIRKISCGIMLASAVFGINTTFASVYDTTDIAFPKAEGDRFSETDFNSAIGAIQGIFHNDNGTWDDLSDDKFKIGGAPDSDLMLEVAGKVGATQYCDTDGLYCFTGADVTTGGAVSLRDIDTDTGIQVEKSADEDVIRFDTAGEERMIIDSDGKIDLPNTTFATGNNGVISKNGTPFMHNFNYGDNGTVTTLGENVFVGDNAGNFTMGSSVVNNHEGSFNLGIGNNTLSANTSGYYNVAIGHLSMLGNTDGHHNTSVGAASFYKNTTGYNNSVLGDLSLHSNTTGHDNTAIGHYAGAFISGGGYVQNQTSSSSVYLGANTKSLASGDTNEIVIGYNTTGKGSNTVNLGNDSITETHLNGEINLDNYKLPIADGSVNQVLKTNGSGALTWQNDVAGGSDLWDADSDTGIQVEESADEDIIRFDAGGSEVLTMNSEGKITLPNTTGSNTNAGVIYKDSKPFMHNFNYGDNGTVTTLGKNVFVGEEAGNLTMGSSATNAEHSSYNVGVGTSSLSSNTQGYANTTIGSSGLLRNTSGSNNTALGGISMVQNITGSNNVAVGYISLYQNTTGSDNLALGRSSGAWFGVGYNQNKNSSQSLYIGGDTRALAASGTNEIVIGYAATGKGSNTVNLGNDSITETHLNGEINLDNYKLPTADGSVNQVLKTDGSGALTWQNDNAGGSDLWDADSDTGIQVEESADEDVIRFDAGGTEVLTMNSEGKITLPNTTGLNTKAGVLYKDSTPFMHNFNYGDSGTVTTLGENTFVGVNSGNFTMGSGALNVYEGSFNTGIGSHTLTANTSGYSNVALGYEALISNTEGHTNTAIGTNTLRSNTTGSNNSAVGTLAMYGNTTGNDNVAFGKYAGNYIANGSTLNKTSSSSVYLGYKTKALADGDTNEIVIGYDTTGNGSNTVTLGNDSITETHLKGVVVQGTASSAPTGVEGGIYYNSSDKHFYGHNGTTWVQLDN